MNPYAASWEPAPPVPPVSFLCESGEVQHSQYIGLSAEQPLDRTPSAEKQAAQPDTAGRHEAQGKRWKRRDAAACASQAKAKVEKAEDRGNLKDGGGMLATAGGEGSGGSGPISIDPAGEADLKEAKEAEPNAEEKAEGRVQHGRHPAKEAKEAEPNAEEKAEGRVQHERHPAKEAVEKKEGSGRGCATCGAKKQQVCRHFLQKCCTRPKCAFCHCIAEDDASQSGDGYDGVSDCPKAQRHRKNDPSLYYERLTDLERERGEGDKDLKKMVSDLIKRLVEGDLALEHLHKDRPELMSEICLLAVNALRNHANNTDLAKKVAVSCCDAMRPSDGDDDASQERHERWDAWRKALDQAVESKSLRTQYNPRDQENVWRNCYSGRRRPKLPDKSQTWWPKLVPPVPWRGVFGQLSWHFAFVQLDHYFWKQREGARDRNIDELPIKSFMLEYTIHLERMVEAERRRVVNLQKAMAKSDLAHQALQAAKKAERAGEADVRRSANQQKAMGRSDLDRQGLRRGHRFGEADDGWLVSTQHAAARHEPGPQAWPAAPGLVAWPGWDGKVQHF